MKAWSVDEVNLLRERVGNTKAADIAILHGRSKVSILHKIHKLGLSGTRTRKHVKWPQEQIDALIAEGPTTTTRGFSEKHGLSFVAVRHMAYKLRVKFSRDGRLWTTEELDNLRASKTVEDAMTLIGRGRKSVLVKARAIGVDLEGKFDRKKRKIIAINKSDANTKPSRVGTIVKAEKSLVERCPVCTCLVSNWAEHFRRLPGCQIARKQA